MTLLRSALFALLMAGTAIAQPAPEPTPIATNTDQMLALLAAGKQGEAEQGIIALIKAHREDQRAMFAASTLIRSRFDIAPALKMYTMTAALDPQSTYGQASNLMLSLDRQQEAEANFAKLQALVAANPTDIMLRWAFAIQCRSLKQDAEGAAQYAEILKVWNPGPALVHQTYGNLLDNLQRYDEALVERNKTVEQEPASWSYKSLGITLTHLKRYTEADAAYAKAVEIAPTRADLWQGWAWMLFDQGRLDEAIVKCQRAIELDPTLVLAYDTWGDSLYLQGKYPEALEKYKASLAIDPDQKKVMARVKRIEKKLSKSGADAPLLDEPR